MPAASFFLQITLEDGVIKGEAEEEGFEGAIEVSSWDWSVSDKTAKDLMSRDNASSSAAQGGSGTPTTGGSNAANAARTGQSGEKSTQPTPVRFSKTTDRSTVRLLNAMYKDEKFKEAKFSLRQRTKRGAGDGREVQEEFLLELVLKKARVTSYDFNAQAQEGDVQMSENWEMSYDTLYYDYKSMPGRPVGPGKSVEFGPPDANTKAPKQPQMSQADLAKKLEQQEAELARLRRGQRS